MNELTEPEYWDEVWRNSSSLTGKLTGVVLDLLFRLDPSNRGVFGLVAKALPRSHGTLLEIGCAPGRWLAYFHRRFGVEVYGVDYSEAGCGLTERFLEKKGVRGAEIIHADVLSRSFLEEFEGRFDLVCSFGVVEHFEDLGPIIDAHRRLLAPGGYVVLTIPNYGEESHYRVARQASGQLSALSSTHNLDIMDLPQLRRSLGKFEALEVLRVDYVGTPSLVGLLGERLNPRRLCIRYPLYLALHVLTILFGYVPFKPSARFSPTIAAVCRRR